MRPSVRPCVRPFTLSNMNISATSWPIGMKFYLKHHWGGGKASVGFDPDWIRTLVSMATDSSHRVIMGKTQGSKCPSLPGLTHWVNPGLPGLGFKPYFGKVGNTGE